MLPKQEVVAMLLAGGQGSRLGVLTKKLAKPAVPLYIMLIILVCKYLKSILAKIVLVPCLSALILVVAYSRVYLGVHYITDIIGGWLIGFAITLIVYTVCRLTFLKR